MSNILLIIISIVGYGIGSFLYKLANAQIHPIMVSTIALILYMILAPLAWIYVKFEHTLTLMGTIYAVIGSLFLCIGTLGFSYALKAGGAAGQTTFMISLYPSLTLILSFLFLKEEFTLTKVAGCLCALVSIFFLSR